MKQACCRYIIINFIDLIPYKLLFIVLSQKLHSGKLKFSQGEKKHICSMPIKFNKNYIFGQLLSKPFQ